MHIPPISNNPFHSSDDEARFQNLRYGLVTAYALWTQHPHDRTSIEALSNFLKSHKEDFAWAISDRLALPYDVVGDLKVKYLLVSKSVETLLDPSISEQGRQNTELGLRFSLDAILKELRWS